MVRKQLAFDLDHENTAQIALEIGYLRWKAGLYLNGDLTEEKTGFVRMPAFLEGPDLTPTIELRTSTSIGTVSVHLRVYSNRFASGFAFLGGRTIGKWDARS